MKLAVGTMVNPRVRLLRPLGRGAMGSVWVGEHLTLETEVAVKFIKPELSAGDDDEPGPDHLVERFKREAKAAAKIKSPHVVQTLDQGFMDDGTPYIVMELLEGESLGARLGRSKRVGSRELAQIVTQVCRGLSKAHELGIVHRDIKPDNLFLIGAGDELLVKILDFGVAKQVRMPESAATASGTLVGTPQYMSPEQLLRAGVVDAQADLWALAVVTYQALLGMPPFDGETLAGIIVAITRATYERPSRIDERLSGAVEAWFDRALALEPADRFSNAKQFADAFGEAVAELHDEALPRSATDDEGAGTLAGLGEHPVSEVTETAEFIAEAELNVDTEAGAARPGADREPEPSEPERSEPIEEPAADSSSPELDEPSSPAVPARTGATQTSASATPPQAPTGPPGTRRSLFGAIGLGLAVLFAIAWWVAASEDGSSSPSPTPDRTVAPGGSGSAMAVASSTAASSATREAAATSVSATVATGVNFSPVAVEPGRTPDGRVWLAAYRLERFAGDQHARYLDAQAACRKRSKALCTEAQWLRACSQSPAVGELASWTASAVHDEGFVVRGGGGCDARQVVPPTSAERERAGLCCDRAVGIRSSNTNRAFVASTATKLDRIEQAFSTSNSSLLSSLVTDAVSYRGKVLPRKVFVQSAIKAFQVEPAGWIQHDTCEVALFEEDGHQAWSADCSCVTRQGPKLGAWLRRYVHDGESGKLRSIEVPTVYRAAAAP